MIYIKIDSQVNEVKARHQPIKQDIIKHYYTNQQIIIIKYKITLIDPTI